MSMATAARHLRAVPSAGSQAAAGMATGAACRYGRGFGGSGTIGRGPRMYEMQGPRPVSRHRPAEFSASFAPCDHLPGPGTLPVFRSTGSPGGSGTPRAVARDFLIASKPGFPPSRVAPSTSLAGGSELSFRPMTGVSPEPKGSSFPFAGWLRAFPSACNSGFPLRRSLKRLPFAGGPELSSPHITRGFPSATRFEVLPEPGGPGSPLRVSPGRLAPGRPRDQRPQSLPNTRWSGVSPAPVARSFPRTDGAGLLLARRPGVALCRVARGFPFAGYRPWW